LLFFSFFIDGFAYAGEALVGKYIGSNSISKLRKVVKLLFIWGFGLALAFTLLYLPGVNIILKILTSQTDVIESAQAFLPWVIMVPVASFASYIWDGIYIGATASKAMRNTLLISTFVFFAPVYYFLNPILGNHALWLGMLLFMFMRGAVQTILYKRVILKSQHNTK